MDTQRAARAFRAVRRHRGLRQADVAARAGVSQQHVSDLERGQLAAMSFGEGARLFAALDISVALVVSWRGGELDRLLDEGHSAVCGRTADLLAPLGWQVLTEVTFSVYGERGSIDLLAWHAATRTLLVIEVKTEIASAEEMLRRHDVKVRLARGICRERFGVLPAEVCPLLVVVDTSTNRARAARLGSLLGKAYPCRGAELRHWLARPAGSMRGLLFLNTAKGGATAVRPSRIRTR